MTQKNKLTQRFAELAEQAQTVLATKRFKGGGSFEGDYVDDEAFTNWKVKVLHLLGTACGEQSIHYKRFLEREDGGWSTNYQVMLQLMAVFQAAREDFDGGYFASVRSLVQAEVFSTELDQASELLRAGFFSAAAVIAGVVLETSLRELCDRHGLPTATLNPMNQDLAKAGVYNKLEQKRITAFADIRNNAAHGHPDQFSEKDVREMISGIEAFLADHLD